jgi:plasmid stability protein
MSDEPEYRALTLRMPPELHAAVRASAAEHERSWGGEIRHIVKSYLAAGQEPNRIPADESIADRDRA